MTTDSNRIDGDRDGCPTRLRLDRGRQTLVGEERRVDATRQVTQSIERFISVPLELGQDRPGPVGVLQRLHLRQPKLDLERDEVLLGTIVQVALDPAPFTILRRDQPLPRRTEVLEPRRQVRAEPHVLEHQPGLVGKVVEQLLLDGRERLANTLADAQRPQQLVLLANLDNPVGVGRRGDRPVAQRHRPDCRNAQRPRCCGTEGAAGAQPDVCTLGAGAFGENPRHAGKHVIHGVALRDLFGELRQHLVRCRALSVDQPVGHPLHPLSHRLETDRNDRRGQDRQPQVGPATTTDQGPDADSDADVHRGDEDRQRTVDQGAADHDVDVVQPVLEDRHRGADGKCREPDHGDGAGRLLGRTGAEGELACRE
ncbi:MAG TPA: hypothetical protein VIG86_05370 [Candidatus Dormibacteraeota bacterium]